MKRLSIIFVVAVFALSVSGVVAYSAGESNETSKEKSLQDIMKEIRKSQGVSNNQQIDCSKVTDKQYEKLGDAFMDVMHPNEQQHQFMDRMMGGEGSPSLAYMHRIMGARYLGCYSGGPGYGMMDGYGGGMMRGYGGGMMGGYGGGMMDGYGGGMMRGYGGGMMRGYGGGMMWNHGYQPAQPAKALTKDDAKAMVGNYLKTLRNPNLKTGKIKQSGNAFAVDIVTKGGSLVDKIVVDKNTGYMQSIYQ